MFVDLGNKKIILKDRWSILMILLLGKLLSWKNIKMKELLLLLFELMNKSKKQWIKPELKIRISFLNWKWPLKEFKMICYLKRTQKKNFKILTKNWVFKWEAIKSKIVRYSVRLNDFWNKVLKKMPTVLKNKNSFDR